MGHPEYGEMPGNQEPNTPDYNESEHYGHEHESHHGHHAGEEHGSWSTDEIDRADPSDYKDIPGNQTANTPDVNESEQ